MKFGLIPFVTLLILFLNLVVKVFALVMKEFFGYLFRFSCVYCSSIGPQQLFNMLNSKSSIFFTFE